MANKHLILGRAGSGKTHLVLNKFLEFTRVHREKQVLFLLPTRSQVEHLKDVILKRPAPEQGEGMDVKGFLDVSFFTFGSLASWIWESGATTQDPPLPKGELISQSAKDLLLKNILFKHRVEYFEEVYDSSGFRQVILKFIKELKENSLSPQQFETIINNLAPVETRTNEFTNAAQLTEKYAGLASTYARFQQTLDSHGLLDSEGLLNVLFNKLENDSELLAWKEILLVDGFHDFTPIEFKILSLLVQRIPDVYITLSLDPNLREKQVAVFQTASRTYRELSSLNLIETPLESGTSFRTQEPIFKHIERNLFRKHGDVTDADDALCIIEATNIRDEVDQMARRIYDMVISGDVRYKDIGVIFRDVDKYCDIIENIFPEYGIPVRLYANRPLRENYAIKALLNLLNVFRENWNDKWVIKTLKSDYLDLDKELVDSFEQAALKKGIINSRKGWLALAKQTNSSQIKQFLDIITKLENDIKTNQTPSFFKEWFLNVIDKLVIVRDPLTRGHNIKRDVAAIQTITSLLNDVVRVCEIENVKVETQYTLLKTEELYFHEFVDMLLPLIDVATYSIKDKRDDVVNVIDAVEARQWELPIVFVGGLLEREFPKQVRENLFIKDKVRRVLNEQNDIRLKEELKGGDEERYLFYVAMTRARERLFLSYPSTNDTGNRNLPSFFLLEVKKLITKESYERVLNHRSLSEAVHNVDDILLPGDLQDYVFYQLNAPYRKGSPEEKSRNLTLWFYNQMRTDEKFIEEIRTSLENRCDAFINSDSVIDKLKQANFCYSATQLNNFAQCPFLHFYKHVLKIAKPPSLAEDGLDSMKQGSIMHKTLEKYIRSRLDPEQGAGTDIYEIFEKVFDRHTKGIGIGFKELKIKGELEATIRAFIAGERDFAERYKLHPLHAEAMFGIGGRRPVIINDPEIGDICLKGMIDRIDVAEMDGSTVGVVLDYKYSKYGFNKAKEEEVLQGLDLQLPIYLMAAASLFNIEPIGAEFYTLKNVERSGMLNKDFIEKGILPSKLPRGTKMLSTTEFESLIENCKNLIVKYAGEIINGDIAIRPANPDRCGSDRCDYADVCRFEKWMIGKDK